jgi:hypothetical protein
VASCAINDTGTIVIGGGGAQGSETYLLSGGTFQDLGFESYVVGLNSTNEILGGGAGDADPGYIYASGVQTVIPSLSGDEGAGVLAINDAGTVLAEDDPDGMGYLYVPSLNATMPLGALGGCYTFASGMNASTAVVGYSSLPASPTSNAPCGVVDLFLYRDGIMIDVNQYLTGTLAQYVKLSSAGYGLSAAINDSGVIVAQGVDSRTGTTVHTYVLTPTGATSGPSAARPARRP